MNARTKALILAVFGISTLGVFLARRHAAPPDSWAAASHAKTSAARPAAPLTVPEAPPPQAIAPPPIKSIDPAPPKPVAPSHPKTAQVQPQKPPKEPLEDPDARDALALVGLDPQAEEYWLGAIFDTSLPDKERDDLMEDLNEVGFADPDHPTAADLPLIANRLQIIEQVEPEADPFMRIHLIEAYKDLANMYEHVTAQ